MPPVHPQFPGRPAEQGFSLVEAMLSAAAFSIVVTSFAGALILGQQATLGSGQRGRAANLAEEGIESVRSIRDQAFNELQYAQSGVQVASNTWAFLGEGTTETIDEFTRTISFADVCRNGSYVIAACPATYIDPRSKQVTVTVTWPVGPGSATDSVTRVSYLTDWESTAWTQTNWFGGSGQSVWSDATKYDSDDGHIDRSTSGEIKLASTGSSASPVAFTDSTQATFNAGSHSNTQYNTTNSWLELTGAGQTAGAGTFTSRIFDAGAATTWSAVNWTPQRPLGKELPDGGASESDYPTGNANMSGNKLLLHLNEAAGATTFTDTSGSGNTASCSVSCPTAGTAGKLQKALSFNGTSNYVDVPSNSGLESGSAFTVSAWVYLNAITSPDHNPILWKGTQIGWGANYMFRMAVKSDGTMTWGVTYGSTEGYFEAGSITTGKWTHVALSYDGATARAYINGAQVGTNGGGSAANTFPGSPIRSGFAYRSTSSETTYLNGKVDEIGYWDRTLSATEVNDMYQRGALNLQYQVRSCDDSACAGESFAGPDGTGSTYYSELSNSTTGLPSLSLTNVPVNEYLQYRATLSTSDTSLSPQLVQVTWSGTKPGQGLPWWDAGYGYRKKITFGTSHSALASGYTATVSADTRSSAHVALVSGNDVRVVWQPLVGNPVELDRIGGTWNNAATSIDFRLQSAISANLNEDVDGSYYLYYGNASAGTPPTNEMGVYYFADFFNRSDSSTVGNGWTEWNTTPNGDMTLSGGKLFSQGQDTGGPPDTGIKQTFPLGALPGNFTLQFDWTMTSNSEAEWTHYVNIGNGSTMTNSSRTTGVGPGIYTGEGAHFSPNGTENVSNNLSGNMENNVHGGPYSIKMVVNTSAKTYDYYRNGTLRASNKAYVTSQSTLNQIRIANDDYDGSTAAPFQYDNVKITLDVSSAPAMALDTEQSLSATTFADDTQSEFNAGTYTSNTQYNTGTSLVDLTSAGKTAGTGTYTSKIQDAGLAAVWQTFGWVPNRPVGRELPNSGATETGYPTGNMAMTNNWALYHLNEASGATSFADSSGNSRTGSCTSTACPAVGTGEFNNGFTFDGSDDRITIGSTSPTGSALTLSAWVKETSLPSGNPEVVSRDTSGNTYIWSLGFRRVNSTTAKVSFRIRTGTTTTTLNSTANYTIGSWMHIAGVYDGSTMTIYKNGDSVGSTSKTGTLSTSAATTLIGDQTPDSETGFIGTIDEVGIWNRALSGTEVSDMYLRGALSMKYQVRSCDDAACAGESFAGPDGTSGTYYTDTATTTTPSYTLTNVPVNRYFQYQATLTTADATETPEIQSVSVTYPSGAGGGSGYATAGSLQSSAFNMSDSSPVESIEWDQSVPTCSPACTVKVQVRTAPNASGSPGTWTAWYGATGSGTYFTANTGTRIPLALNGNQWVQYRVELAGDGTDSPVLQEVRLYYR